MDKVRLFRKQQPVVQIPQTSAQWATWMRQVVARATLLKHPYLVGLLDAQARGDNEGHLRRLGLVCPSDLDRDMPVPA